MKDYANYRPPSKETLLWSNRKAFQNHLDIEGKDILIGKTPTKGLVRYHTNPINEFKENRKLTVWSDTELKRGDIIQTLDDNRSFLTISAINENEIVKYALMREVNHNLKFIDSNNKLITKPCIVSAKTLYTTGVRDEKVIEIPNGMVGIQLPYDEDTKKLKRDDSFNFNDTKYRITFLNKVEFQGLLILICDEEAVDELTDDLENEIANRYIDGKDRLDNTQPDIENPDIPTNPPTEDNFTISITGQDAIQLMNEQTYNAKVYNNGVEVADKLITWTKTTDLANIKSQDGNTITLSANTKWNTGEFKLRATLVDDETIFAEKTLYVTS